MIIGLLLNGIQCHIDQTLQIKKLLKLFFIDPAYYPTPTGDGEIIFQYKEVEEAGSCTIGIENNSENVGLQYLFNEIYDATANEVSKWFCNKIYY